MGAYIPAARSSSPRLDIEIPVLISEHQEATDSADKLRALETKVPVALNFPVLVVQIPYILVRHPRREWVPRGMFPEQWRALAWPIAGIFFWWLVGRGIDALRAARKSSALPSITSVETAFAGLLFAIGIVSLIGLITSTPDDRRDFQFLALLTGGLLWGVLAAFTIGARFFQWRIHKRTPEPVLI